MGARVAVFGASGFVGRAVVAELARQGHEALPLRTPRLATPLRDLAGLTIEAAELLPDLTSDLVALRDCDIVINAAGMARPESQLTDELVGANALWPALLTMACTKAGVRRLVHISSAAVHGSQRVLLESSAPHPITPYGMTKLWGDDLARAQRGRAELVIYRPTSVHGEDRETTRKLKQFSESPLSSVAGTGLYPSPQVLVENVASAAVMLAFSATVPDHPVVHPSEGMTTGGLLSTLSGRGPRHIPVVPAKAMLMAAKLVGKAHPWLAAQARRLEMLWFGQCQREGWLDQHGFRPTRPWTSQGSSSPRVDRPRILVLLAAYNGRQFLDEQLVSILGQVDVDVEILIGVDQSSDGTEELVDSWVASDRRIQSLPHGSTAGGASQNFFRLIEAANTEGFDAVALSDQDDIWEPRKLIRAVGRLESDQADGYSSNAWIWDPRDDSRSLLDKAQPQRRWDHLFSSAGPGCTYVYTAAAFGRYAAWQRTIDTDGIDYHDWLMYAWFRQHDLKWVIDQDPSLDYRQHATNQIGANHGFAAWRSRARQVTNGWYSNQVLRVASAVGGRHEHPVELVSTGRLFDRLRLIANANQLRRKSSEQLALIVLLLAETLARGRSSRPAEKAAP